MRTAQSPGIGATMGRMRILVVDDERAVRESLGRALELEGYRVEYAADGGEALYRLESEQPDAIVLDVLMPGIDGLEVARRVRRAGNRVLELFLRNPRQVLTRSVIFERVWGYDFGFASNSLDVYIGYLRRKTEAGAKSRLIQTVRGVGYALRET